MGVSGSVFVCVCVSLYVDSVCMSQYIREKGYVCMRLMGRIMFLGEHKCHHLLCICYVPDTLKTFSHFTLATTLGTFMIRHIMEDMESQRG